MMLDTVMKYMEDANYFTIEFRSKFNDYDIQSKPGEKTNGKTCWKQFFSENHADETKKM